MNIKPIIHAAVFGICLCAGISHLMVELKRRPLDRVQLSAEYIPKF